MLLGYTNITEVFRQPNVNAFLVKGGFWIDVHVSSTLGEEQAAKLFDRFLGSIRIADSK